MRREPFSVKCPRCDEPITVKTVAETYIYVCSTHGQFFIAAKDGRLYDMPATKH